MSLFEFFREQAQSRELQRLADVSRMMKIESKLAEARNHQERVSNGKRIEELEEEVARLTIVLEAMIEKLYEARVLSEESLAGKISEIDGRDGVPDGKITKPKKEPKKEPKRALAFKKPVAKMVKLQLKKSEKEPVKFNYSKEERKPFIKDSSPKKKY